MATSTSAMTTYTTASTPSPGSRPSVLKAERRLIKAWGAPFMDSREAMS